MPASHATATPTSPPKPSVVGALTLAVILLVAGAAHFVAPRGFETIIPKVFPQSSRRPLVYGSGVAEVATGLLLLWPRTRVLGGRIAAALFVAVFPGNVQAALDGGYKGVPGFAGSATAAWLRLPLQLPLILIAARIGGWRLRTTTDEPATP